MNSYEKARDEAAEKEMVELTWKHIIANRDIHIEFLDGQIEALRAAVRSAYDALSSLCDSADRASIYNEVTPHSSMSVCSSAGREAMETLKPFLEPTKLPLDSEAKEGALPIGSDK